MIKETTLTFMDTMPVVVIRMNMGSIELWRRVKASTSWTVWEYIMSGGRKGSVNLRTF
jgi:hypothetical protein